MLGNLLTSFSISTSEMNWAIEFQDERIKFRLNLNRPAMHRFWGARQDR
jgi:hypothetical protein